VSRNRRGSAEAPLRRFVKRLARPVLPLPLPLPTPELELSARLSLRADNRES
jgi:hypothetical protein